MRTHDPSIRMVVAELGTPVPKGVVLDIDEGTKFLLSYVGKMPVAMVCYKGQTRNGTISHATYPEFLYGAGAVTSAAKGTKLRMC